MGNNIMVIYIDQTKADELDANWSGTATQAEIDKALLQANVWLNGQTLIAFDDEIPLAIHYAGVELAKIALSGSLFEAVEKVQSKTVSAQSGTSVSKTYAEALDNESRDIRYVRALISPYMASSNHFYVDRG